MRPFPATITYVCHIAHCSTTANASDLLEQARMFLLLVKAFVWDRRVGSVDEETVLSFRAHLPLCDWCANTRVAVFGDVLHLIGFRPGTFT